MCQNLEVYFMADGKFRDRKMCILLYPDNPSHTSAIQRLQSPEYRAVGILHDKDTWTEEDQKENPEHKAGELKKEQWHFVAKWKNADWNEAVAKDLGIEPRFIAMTKTFEGGALYLLHYNNPEKYQYNIEDCKGTLVPELKKLIADETEDCRVLRILDLLDKHGFLTMSDFIKLVCKEGLYSDVRRAGYLMAQMLKEHNDLCVDPETGEVLS